MPNLDKRNFSLQEQMDNPSCNLTILENTYSQFGLINGLLSGWRRIYLSQLRPIISKTANPTLLDIGFGGGDIAIKLQEWAKNDKLNLKITAIETDNRSIDYIKKLSPTKTAGIDFRLASLEDLTREAVKFDLVISNHVLHHLAEDQLKSILEQSKDLAKQLVIHNDLERNSLALNLFKFSKYFFKNSFITNDGLISIQRSFRKNELQKICGSKWEVRNFFPFRLIALNLIKK